MFHEDGDHDVDQDELSDEDKNNEEDWRDDAADAAVVNTVIRRVAVLSQRVLTSIIIILYYTSARFTINALAKLMQTFTCSNYN